MYCVPWDNLKLTTAGAALLSTVEAKQHARIDSDAEDALIDDYVRAATSEVEEMLGMALVSSTWTAHLDLFPPCREIAVPRVPLVSVTSITCVDPDGLLHAMPAADYYVVSGQWPGRIVLADGADWPEARLPWGDVRITVTLGYGPPAAVPEVFKQAVRLKVTRHFEQRDDHQQTLDSAIAMIVRNHGNRRAA